MKKINCILLICLCALLCNCNNQTRTNTDTTTDSITTDTTVIIVKEKEDFDTFFNQFQQDSVFQKDRVTFPLKLFLYEWGAHTDDAGNIIDSTIKEIIINKTEWSYEDFNEYKKIISQNSENKYDIKLQIVDTGVDIHYIFKLVNDKWYLIEIKDESM